MQSMCVQYDAFISANEYRRAFGVDPPEAPLKQDLWPGYVTINADQHPLMQHFHRPEEEKRMVVILPEDRYCDWLHAPVHESADFLLPYPVEALRATGAVQRQASLFG